MTRQEQLKEIGEMIPDKFMSKIIIPIPHNFYDNNSAILWNMRVVYDWKILNSKNREIGAFNIKKYIYDNMIPNIKDKDEHINKNKSVLLRKEIKQNAKLDHYDFYINSIDLWIFDEHVGFFTLDIDIDHSKYTIDQLSEFNRQFREFKFLNVEKNNQQIIFKKAAGFTEPNEVLSWLLNFTTKDGLSFLNTTKEDCINSQIYNTSTNAKLMTAVQTKTTTFSNGQEIEPLHTEDLHFTTINGTSTLEEVPFYLASCSTLSPIPGYTNNEEYIHSLVDNGGFNIWKYSSGITIYDSFALFGLGYDGGPIVSNMKNNFYFIYMLNLYINIQIRFIEYELINQDFESLDIQYRYKQLQILKNQFIAKEIAIKFQDNEIHKSILSALNTEDMISEVTENLIETKDITQNQLGIYITLFGFIAVSILEESLTKLVVENPIFISVSTLISITIWFKFKNNIKKKLRSIIS
jgi:hypothetical protein